MKHQKGRKRTYEESSKEKYETLKGELKKLRKEILQLRKENAKLRGRDFDLQEFFKEMQDEESNEVATQHACPKCGSSVDIMEKLQGGKDYYFCKNDKCGSRGPL